MTSPTSLHGTLPRRLFQEWHWLCGRPDALERARCWPLDTPPPASLDELLQRCGYGGRRDDDRADELLARLLTVATYDTLATRVVLQRVLPGMLAIAHRRSVRRPQQTEALLAELVGAMWVIIRSSPADRRRHHVAAHLLRTADYEAFRRSARRVHHRREVPVGGAVTDLELAVDPTTAWLEDPRRQLEEVLGCGRANGMHRGDLDLLASLGEGETTERMATRLGITDRAVRARRATAVARLREVMAAA